MKFPKNEELKRVILTTFYNKIFETTNIISEETFLVFIRIRWIGTGSHPFENTMSSTELYPAFYEYKIVKS